MAPIHWTQGLQKLWSDYLKTNQPTHRVPKTEQFNWVENDTQHSATVTTYELSENGQTMRYTVDVIGNGPQPAEGYPLYIGLHGGGGPPDVAAFKGLSQAEQDRCRQSNDDEWYIMSQNWYINGIRTKGTPAIYVAPRGITNTWDLGFRPETYVLIQRLIRNLLLKQPIEAGTGSTTAPTFIDGNRVYLLGFSAGGDAVYRHSTMISDCFGAVNMSAGQPGDVKLDNLANLPICLQVGENDDGYNRMVWTANTSIELFKHAAAMKKIEQSKPYYVHDCFIHPGQGHSNWDDGHNKPNSQDYGDNDISVVARDKDSLEKWCARNKNGIDPNNGTLDTYDEHVNTSAITWVSQHSRDPVPPYVIWHLGSRPPRPKPFDHVVPAWEPKRYFYWLMINKNEAEKSFGDNDIIRASYDRNDNAVWIRRTPDKLKLTILLNDTMLKLGQNIKIFYGPAKTTLTPLKVNESVQIQKMTLDARGDPNLIFSAALSFDPSTKKAVNGLFSESTVKALL